MQPHHNELTEIIEEAQADAGGPWVWFQLSPSERVSRIYAEMRKRDQERYREAMSFA
jgi:hypothetical protein